MVARNNRLKHKQRPPKSLHLCLDDCAPSVDSTQESSNASFSAVMHIQETSIGVLTEDRIKAHLYDFYDDLNANRSCKIPEVWRALYEKYHSPEYILIRPSGNPLTSEGFVHMHCSNDVEVISFSLISIDSLHFMGANTAAVATYTIDQKFTYKGTLNEDRCVVSCILDARNGDVRICHEHRTTGQPIPKQTRWNAA